MRASEKKKYLLLKILKSGEGGWAKDDLQAWPTNACRKKKRNCGGIPWNAEEKTGFSEIKKGRGQSEGKKEETSDAKKSGKKPKRDPLGERGDLWAQRATRGEKKKKLHQFPGEGGHVDRCPGGRIFRKTKTKNKKNSSPKKNEYSPSNRKLPADTKKWETRKLNQEQKKKTLKNRSKKLTKAVRESARKRKGGTTLKKRTLYNYYRTQ